MTELQAQLIAAVRAHAEAHYETDGWDFIVECFEDADILAEIEGCETPEAAIAEVARTARLQDERRREVQATVW